GLCHQVHHLPAEPERLGRRRRHLRRAAVRAAARPGGAGLRPTSPLHFELPGDLMRGPMARLCLCAAALLGLPAAATAQAAQAALPKTIKIVVPFSPGASNDAVARAIAVPL